MRATGAAANFEGDVMAMQTGVIKRFSPASKGYGFIVPDDESPDVFFHVKDCRLRNTFLQVGDRVAFEINQFAGRDSRKRREACEVRVIK
jgi:cold shock CspA family protein